MWVYAVHYIWDLFSTIFWYMRHSYVSVCVQIQKQEGTYSTWMHFSCFLFLFVVHMCNTVMILKQVSQGSHPLLCGLFLYHCVFIDFVMLSFQIKKWKKILSLNSPAAVRIAYVEFWTLQLMEKLLKSKHIRLTSQVAHPLCQCWWFLPHFLAVR